MKNLSKKGIFKVPEHYFDTLSDQILEKRASQKTKMFYLRSMAAAAVVIIGVAVFVFKNEVSGPDYFNQSIAEDINLYINAGHWGAEEVLNLSDDPNLILDQIIDQEWGNYNTTDFELENDFLY
ncbi:hypothetical protein MM236_00405 [Belliella sp. DSM 107340]|uniref:DUF3379 domain-containing protein n=1 Tax=Belliella calami TaxID=2923436 RepID=A0ABS9UJ21_9BACT|nr:hypothetical protein [Belliella calami]MCH7396420.1 hypothetical protein [Belliella calami]